MWMKTRESSKQNQKHYLEKYQKSYENMVVAETMNKPVLKVSMESDSSSTEESEPSDSEIENVEEDAEDDIEADAESDDPNAESGDSVAESTVSDVESGAPEADSDAPVDESGASDAESDAPDAESGGSNAGGESSDGEENDKAPLVTNEGWADSVAKILGSSKPKNKKTLVLSRAKKHADIVKTVKEEKPAFEVIDEIGEKKPVFKKEEVVSSEPPAKRVKHEKPSIRVKPNVLEKDRERLLNKIATKGVVQLFNAVRNQQKSLEQEMDRNDLSESKKEKILKKFDKRAFLDTLMGQSKSIIIDEATKVAKNEIKDEDKPKWSALRDDFMMGAKMKDWDKESIDE